VVHRKSLVKHRLDHHLRDLVHGRAQERRVELALPIPLTDVSLKRSRRLFADSLRVTATGKMLVGPD